MALVINNKKGCNFKLKTSEIMNNNKDSNKRGKTVQKERAM